jgi:uncharacterized protein (TIGR02147 family)
VQNAEFLVQHLKDHFEANRRKNPSYSLRSMARALKTSPAQLSQVMSGKRPLSVKFASKIADRFGLSSSGSSVKFDGIEEDRFKLISDWEHFAILSMSRLSDCRADARWISRRLGIDYFAAKHAFQRLLEMGLIEIVGKRYRQTSKPLHTTHDIPSSAIRAYHRQNLELASDKIDEAAVDAREYTSVTVATSMKKLPLAKKMIRRFKDEIFDFLGRDESEEVYTLSIQLFPVTKPKNGG